MSSSLLMDSNYSTTFECARDMSSSTFIDYDKAWLEANADDNFQQNIAMDQYIEQIAIKHEVIL